MIPQALSIAVKCALPGDPASPLDRLSNVLSGFRMSAAARMLNKSGDSETNNYRAAFERNKAASVILKVRASFLLFRQSHHENLVHRFVCFHNAS
jgi:hypothetical protein